VLGYVLTEATVATCPHGGSITFSASQDSVEVESSLVLLLDDNAVISGCPFNVSGSPSPCTDIEWLLTSTRLKIENSEVLLDTSLGLCLNAASAPQGAVQITSCQSRVQAA
jgi:hypothetical protein